MYIETDQTLPDKWENWAWMSKLQLAPHQNIWSELWQCLGWVVTVTTFYAYSDIAADFILLSREFI